MPLWLAVVLLLASVAGIVLAHKLPCEKRGLRIACIIVCGVIALACAVYIGLTAVLLDAARNQPVDTL